MHKQPNPNKSSIAQAVERPASHVHDALCQVNTVGSEVVPKSTYIKGPFCTASHSQQSDLS